MLECDIRGLSAQNVSSAKFRKPQFFHSEIYPNAEGSHKVICISVASHLGLAGRMTFISQAKGRQCGIVGEAAA